MPESQGRKSMETLNLESTALVVSPQNDNIAVVIADYLESGTQFRCNGQVITVNSRVMRGQSIAIKELKQGDPYISLGDPIGLASCAVSPGDPIDEKNLDLITLDLPEPWHALVHAT